MPSSRYSARSRAQQPPPVCRHQPEDFRWYEWIWPNTLRGYCQYQSAIPVPGEEAAGQAILHYGIYSGSTYRGDLPINREATLRIDITFRDLHTCKIQAYRYRPGSIMNMCTWQDVHVPEIWHWDSQFLYANHPPPTLGTTALRIFSA